MTTPISKKMAEDRKRALMGEKLEVLANWIRIETDTCFVRTVEGAEILCEKEYHLKTKDYPPCIRCKKMALAKFLGMEVK